MFIHAEWQTPANDSSLLEPLTVTMLFEAESTPEAWQIAKHYAASNTKCDPATVVVKEPSGEEVNNLRAEGQTFHKIDKF